MKIEFDAERHIYTVDGKILPSVTQILRPIMPNYDLANPEMGKRVHVACEKADRDHWRHFRHVSEREPDVFPYLRQWADFCAAESARWEHIEEPLAAGTFAGTPDRIGKVENRAVIIDIKTGPPERWHAAQLAGYQLLAMYNGISVLEAYNVYLAPDGWQMLGGPVSPAATRVFHDCLGVWRWNHAG